MSWIDKIDRAIQLNNELKKEINLFFDSQPYKISTKIESQSGKRVYYLTKAEKIPNKIALIAGDIIQNLRTSLDQMAYKLFLDQTGGKISGSHIYFPIEKDFKTYEREKGRKTKGISLEVLKLIDGIKPYKDGNQTLWRIHELNRLDKHRLLITVGSCFKSMDIGAHMVATMKRLTSDINIPAISLFVKPKDKLFPLRVNDSLFIDMEGSEENPNIKFNFNIALDEVGIIDEEDLLECIKSMIEDVTKFIPIFEK